MRVSLRRSLLVLALALSGCGGEADTATPTLSPLATSAPREPGRHPEPTPRADDSPVAPSAGSASAATQEEQPSAAQQPANGAGSDSTAIAGAEVGAEAGTPPPCERVDRAPLEIMPERGAPGLAASASTLWVAGYRHEGAREWVQVMSVAAGRVHAEAELPVEPPLTQARHAAPAVLHDGERVIVAYTDGRGRLLVATPGRPPTRVSELADIRLSATLTKVTGGFAVTFTDSNGPTPRVIVVRLGANLERVAEHVLHPDYMGGTAPFLVRDPDGSAHRVAFADPRRGLSSLLLAELAADGTPRGEPRTITVVSQLSDPARVVVVEAQDSGRLHIGFTAVDARGATAVGHLVSDGPSNPQPLIANRGYGILDLDGLGLPHGALFVVDSPLAAADTSPRELVVRQVNAQGFSEPLTVRSPDGTARAGRLARLGDGSVMVAYTGLGALFVEPLRCPELAAAQAATPGAVPSAARPPP